MQIVFICGSLEPGRDGVGDYTRRLAAELIKQGHQATVIALNDQHASKINSDAQLQDDIELKVLRLPTTMNIKSKLAHAKEWIDGKNPDLLSLQFVPFAFHPKGLSFQLHKQLKILGGQRKLQIMFHELWVGMARDSDLKTILWGKCQRLLIWTLIKVTKPTCVHTQAQLYQLQLADLGIKATILPLFSNIPVFSNNNGNRVDDIFIDKKPNEISLVLFGGIHPGAPVRQFVEEVAAYALQSNTMPVLKIIGRSSVEQERWANLWRSGGMQVQLLGEQPERNISEILSNSSFGISTTPIVLADKSSALATMREHHLPVICVSKPWYPHQMKDYKMLDGVIDYKKGNFEDVIKVMKSSNNKSVSEICLQFVNSLV